MNCIKIVCVLHEDNAVAIVVMMVYDSLGERELSKVRVSLVGTME